MTSFKGGDIDVSFDGNREPQNRATPVEPSNLDSSSTEQESESSGDLVVQTESIRRLNYAEDGTVYQRREITRVVR